MHDNRVKTSQNVWIILEPRSDQKSENIPKLKIVDCPTVLPLNSGMLWNGLWIRCYQWISIYLKNYKI